MQAPPHATQKNSPVDTSLDTALDTPAEQAQSPPPFTYKFDKTSVDENVRVAIKMSSVSCDHLWISTRLIVTHGSEDVVFPSSLFPCKCDHAAAVSASLTRFKMNPSAKPFVLADPETEQMYTIKFVNNRFTITTPFVDLTVSEMTGHVLLALAIARINLLAPPNGLTMLERRARTLLLGQSKMSIRVTAEEYMNSKDPSILVEVQALMRMHFDMQMCV